jgi:hypothetical protein
MVSSTQVKVALWIIFGVMFFSMPVDSAPVDAMLDDWNKKMIADYYATQAAKAKAKGVTCSAGMVWADSKQDCMTIPNQPGK